MARRPGILADDEQLASRKLLNLLMVSAMECAVTTRE
jgi:hypothetical protein